MTPQQIHFALTPDGDAQIYASKFIGPTNNNGSRFKYWRINVMLESIEPAKTASWVHEGTGQADQLQIALGPRWRVIRQWEALKCLESLTSRLSLGVK